MPEKTWMESHKANLIKLGQDLQVFDRVAIGGGPMTGKSLVAAQLNLTHYQCTTDSFMTFPWADQPEAIITWLNRAKHTWLTVDGKSVYSWVLSGVQVGRCLRKGLVADAVVFLEYPLKPLTSRQAQMVASCKTIFNDWYFNIRKMETPVFFL